MKEERWPGQSLRLVSAALDAPVGEDCAEGADDEDFRRDRLPAEPCDRLGDGMGFPDQPPNEDEEPEQAEESAKGRRGFVGGVNGSLHGATTFLNDGGEGGGDGEKKECHAMGFFTDGREVPVDGHGGWHGLSPLRVWREFYPPLPDPSTALGSDCRY